MALSVAEAGKVVLEEEKEEEEVDDDEFERELSTGFGFTMVTLGVTRVLETGMAKGKFARFVDFIGWRVGPPRLGGPREDGAAEKRRLICGAETFGGELGTMAIVAEEEVMMGSVVDDNDASEVLALFAEEDDTSSSMTDVNCPLIDEAEDEDEQEVFTEANERFREDE